MSIETIRKRRDEQMKGIKPEPASDFVVVVTLQQLDLLLAVAEAAKLVQALFDVESIVSRWDIAQAQTQLWSALDALDDLRPDDRRKS